MSALDRINARPPTGKVPWPLILLEGEEKAGKTYTAYRLTGSDLVGDSFVIDLGEGSADEYAPLGRYQVVEPRGGGDWSFPALLEAVSAVRDHAREQLDAGEKPVVLIIDSISDEWSILVDAITAKAALSKANREKLANDPAAEVKVPNLLWNGANAKHKRLMTLLMTFPGIVVLTARGKEVAEIRNGSPVEGSKTWKVEGQKQIGYQVTAWIRMKRTDPPTLEGCRSLRIGVRPGVERPLELTAGSSEWLERGLEWFIFDGLQVDPATAHIRSLRDLIDQGFELPDGVVIMGADQFLREHVVPSWGEVDRLEGMYREAVLRGIDGDQVTGPDGSQTPLGALIQGRVAALHVNHATPSAPPAAQEPAQGGQGAAQEPPAGPEATQVPPEGSQAAVAPSPAAAGGDEEGLRVLLYELEACETVDDARAVWRKSGPWRDIEIDDLRHGRRTVGQLIMARQRELAETVPAAG